MLAIFLKTVPFFALIGLGYGAARIRFFPEAATAALTKFVFYFALSAMLFRFSASLSISAIFDARLAAAYLAGTLAVYLVATGVAFLRRQDLQTAAIEAQTASIGNTGFLGLPMLALLLGEAAVAPIILMLSIDLIVFASLLVILVTVAREGRMSLGIFATIGAGLVKNPMIVSIVAGLAVSSSGQSLPTVVDEFVTLLGNAATPCALFAIGASLASKSAERLAVSGWLSFAKLVLHPLFVAGGVYLLFPVPPFQAAVAVATAALPVAGNVYMLAQHYGIAPQRVSAAILISTAFSILTVSTVIALVNP
ncbi:MULTISPECIES: AEC family transporter [Salipiger]|uniref:Malonate transporter, putative n=1 Tax=Salipiger bermudensis (strain DSM 26914 / JCM 13377 / KCTC 12554 / HTCC2601) TaxID=314265 RepID=Q0FRJ6_SALBH|nr:AEC family transporter [Salipiger bermudensis]MAE88137.1 AEC family transporter [Pelagibaca sp.]MBR9892934.1 AEC family transporter [bacterium]EAU46858.1 malonate transporter, putative [Salipiger bermudensis HTCC2601]MBN9676071.1 AEC family transporter [Salipiger bermudensis]MCA1287869.1 AEC family transporter [Salipiger bermudensis]